jgi:hypothetical protein
MLWRRERNHDCPRQEMNPGCPFHSLISILTELLWDSIIVVVVVIIIYYYYYYYLLLVLSMLGGSLFSTAWRVLRLGMEGRPTDMEGSCEYID